ncbi:MAG: vWA domain-containing protein [Pseudonocardiaceae bacterium]
MIPTPQFRGAVHQNLYLAEGACEVHAVITVDTEGDGAARAGARAAANTWSPQAAEVLILDFSASMSFPPEKIIKAKEAACVAIDELRDGVEFALISGSYGARMLWPAEPKLVIADPWARAEAKDALRRVDTAGGTTIGAWLRLADQLLSERPQAIRHAILLTDGRNEHELPEQLQAALRDCAGQFSCDCRGVGTDWSVAELRAVSSALHGTVDLIVEPAGLAEDFRTMMAGSMRKTVGGVGLRLWTPAGATVRFVKQTAPTLVDLSTHRVDSGPQTGDYPTGSWGAESRDYHVCVKVEPGRVGEEKLACRVTFVHGSGATGTEQPLEQTFSHTEPDGATIRFSSARVRALWTSDLAQATVINDKVAVVTGKAELAKAVQDGLAAHQRGEPDQAVDHLGRARELAEQVEDTNLLARLDQLYDPDTGTFRLNTMSDQDEMRLDVESTKTTLLSR